MSHNHHLSIASLQPRYNHSVVKQQICFGMYAFEDG